MSDRARDNHGFGPERPDGSEEDRLRPLEDRLRRMSWPQPPPGVRERTLENLHRKLAALDGAVGRGYEEPVSDGGEAAQRQRQRQTR